MVMPYIFQSIEDTLYNVFGSMELVALLIMLALLIAFLIIGIDFRYSIMFVSPLTLAFVEIGWFAKWVSIVFWIMIVMFGGYILWTNIKRD
jgi:hypothetical protein